MAGEETARRLGALQEGESGVKAKRWMISYDSRGLFGLSLVVSPAIVDWNIPTVLGIASTGPIGTATRGF